MVILGMLWRRHWWVPAGVLTTSYAAEKSLQDILGKVVDRGHPPTGLGTYPSGGCARLIAVYGVVWLLVLLPSRGHPRPRRRIVGAGWMVLGVAAAMEGFSRISAEALVQRRGRGLGLRCAAARGDRRRRCRHRTSPQEGGGLRVTDLGLAGPATVRASVTRESFADHARTCWPVGGYPAPTT
jgi:hypothetical protein